jgi:hypothetical protein
MHPKQECETVLEYILIFIAVCVIPGIYHWIRLKMLPKEEQIVVCIPKWQEQHFVKLSGRGNGGKLAYKASDSVQFSLGVYSSQISAMTKQAEKLVAAFQERKRTRKGMDKSIRKDSLADQIQHVFLTTMGQYFSELQLFQYDRMNDDAYCREQIMRLQELLGQSEELLRHYGDYLSALAKSGSVDTAAEREWIAAAIEGMQSAVNGVQNTAPQPEEIPVTQAELDAMKELEEQAQHAAEQTTGGES